MTFPITNFNMIYLHSSLIELRVGEILTPRESYSWSNTTFYQTLEKYRPEHMLAHHEAVFMCQNMEDLDNCMEGLFLFEVMPASRIERHDMQWSTEVSVLVDNSAHEDALREAAEKYWQGVASHDPLWEYLTPHATIVSVHDYMDYEG